VSGSQGKPVATTSSPVAAAELVSAADERVSLHPPAMTKIVATQATDVQATDVRTHYDPMSKSLVASVVDKDTGTVVTEVPPEALRDLAYRTAEFRGRLLDEKI